MQRAPSPLQLVSCGTGAVAGGIAPGWTSVDRAPTCPGLRQTVRDHEQHGWVHAEPDMAAPHLDVLVAPVGFLDARLPGHDPVGARKDRRRGDRQG